MSSIYFIAKNTIHIPYVHVKALIAKLLFICSILCKWFWQKNWMSIFETCLTNPIFEINTHTHIFAHSFRPNDILFYLIDMETSVWTFNRHLCFVQCCISNGIKFQRKFIDLKWCDVCEQQTTITTFIAAPATVLKKKT